MAEGEGESFFQAGDEEGLGELALTLFHFQGWREVSEGEAIHPRGDRTEQEQTLFEDLRREDRVPIVL